jgi:hypothetical protein
MGIINKNTNKKKKNYGIHVLLVASQILLGSMLLVNHLVQGDSSFTAGGKMTLKD